MKHQPSPIARTGLLCFMLLLFASPVYARQGDTAAMASKDSGKVYSYDEVLSYHDSVRRAKESEQMARNMESFSRHYREQERNRKKQAYVRIGIGVLLLVVLVAGLLRKKRKVQG